MKRTIKIISINLGLLFLTAAALEVFIFIVVRVPTVNKILPSFITKISRRVYFFYDCKYVQFFPQSGRWDQTLGYTLKPGRFVFSDAEFSTEYIVNSLGVRDTEAALDSPQIIVLGDSYAMGYGVEQNETFAKLLEAKIGLPVLNASVSSYGTAREMMLLQKAKRDKLKYLIIQYCENDYKENVDFLKHGNKLITMSRETYEQEAAYHRAATRYYFGKFVIGAAQIIHDNYQYLFKIGNYQKIREALWKRPPDEAEVFLNVLANCGMDLAGVQLLVFNATLENTFIKSLQEKCSSPRYPAFIRNMIIWDATESLTDKDLFVLNGHFNQRGQQKIADHLSRYIGH